MITRKGFMATALAAFAAACQQSNSSAVKIGFIVKQPEEPWFQSEWRFADQAAAQYGFELIKIGATDGTAVLTAIDNLGANGASGFVICTPDPALGPAIVQRAAANDLKLMSVDDRLVGADGQPIEAVPHVGISATEIGKLAGKTIADEAARRGWALSDMGLLRISYESLQTAGERINGARDALLEAGLPANRVFDAPQRTTDTEGGFNATGPVLTRQSSIRKWAIVALNDESVLGGVRAAEGLGLGVNDVIAVGINGSGSAEAEFQKAEPTAFFASILLSPKRHGFETAEAMYKWITEDTAPAPVVFTSGEVMNRENWQALKAEQAG